MAKFRTTVTFEVEIDIDEGKFDEAFMAEFRQSFFPFFDVHDHVKHLAQLEARLLLDPFTEGYGDIQEMGIKGRTIGWDVGDVMTYEEAMAMNF